MSSSSTVIDPFDAIKQRKDLSYLDCADLMRNITVQAAGQAPSGKAPQIDKKTLEAMNKPRLRRCRNRSHRRSRTQPSRCPRPDPKTESPSRLPSICGSGAPNFAMVRKPCRPAARGHARSCTEQGADSAAQPTGGLSRHPGAGAGGCRFSPTCRVSTSTPGCIAVLRD